MTTLVLEHIKVNELPAPWVQQLRVSPEQTVTVRIDTEAPSTTTEAAVFVTDDPAFGIWRDRDDMDDVDAFVRRLRASRYNRDGSRNER